MIEYYTGRDASRMTEEEMAYKLAHLMKIREMESQETTNKTLQNLINSVKHE